MVPQCGQSDRTIAQGTSLLFSSVEIIFVKICFPSFCFGYKNIQVGTALEDFDTTEKVLDPIEKFQYFYNYLALK